MIGMAELFIGLGVNRAWPVALEIFFRLQNELERWLNRQSDSWDSMRHFSVGGQRFLARRGELHPFDFAPKLFGDVAPPSANRFLHLVNANAFDLVRSLKAGSELHNSGRRIHFPNLFDPA